MTYQEQYQAWLRDFAGDAATVAELRALEGNEKEIEDRFYTELSFGTAGMRGVLGAGTNRMNLYNVRRATKGFADYINSQNPEYRKRGVVIAYDSRRMSPEFAKASALVLCHEGISVYLFDELRPVPVLSYAVRHLHAIAGIVITASHNPPQYNGYKVYWEDGAQMPPEYADQVLKCIRANRYQDAVEMDEAAAKEAGLLKIIGHKEVDDDYIADVKTLSVQPELMRTAGKALKIVYTPLHGSGNKPVRRILKEIGIENVYVVREQELPDPNFSTIKVPNPEDPAAFAMAMKLADEVGALQERITSTKDGAITSVQAVYVPADDLTDPARQVQAAAKLTADSRLPDVYKLLRDMELEVKKGGLGGNVEFWAGSDVVAVLLGIVEQYVSTVETKPYRVSLEQGRVVVGGYTIRFMDETYPNPQDETEWLPKLNPKVLLAVATNQPGKVWYCAIDSISANNAATPLHIVPVARQDDSGIMLIGQAKPLPARPSRASCKAVVVD